MIKRTITCAICGAQETEAGEGVGWQGWGAIHGIALNGEHNPHLCPVCLAKVAEFADGLKNGVD